MEHAIDAYELCVLHSLAGMMRESAGATIDPQYVAMFLRAAVALDDRALQLDLSGPGALSGRNRHAPVNLTC